MPKTGTTDKKLQGAKLAKETNFSAFNNDLPFWNSTNSPFKYGATFPDRGMQERADINLTMNKLCANSIDEILHEFITDWPIKDPFTQHRVKQIAAELPLYSTIMKTWVQLLSACFTGVKINGIERKDIYVKLEETIIDIIKNQFTCCDRADVCYKDEQGEVYSKIYSDKNIVLHRTKSDERVITITNVEYFDDKQQLETMSYLPDGSIYRNLYELAGGKVGKQLMEPEYIDSGNKALYHMNGASSGDFGMPELYDCFTAVKLATRAFCVYSTLLEWKKNVTLLAPGSAITKDPFTGMATLGSGSAISYDDKNPETMKDNHDVKYVVPELNLKEAQEAVQFSLKQVSLYSQLSDVLLGYRELSGNDSGKAIVANCVSTMTAAQGYIKVFKKELKQLVVNMEHLLDNNITADQVEIVTVNPDEVLLSLVTTTADEKKEEDITVTEE